MNALFFVCLACRMPWIRRKCISMASHYVGPITATAASCCCWFAVSQTVTGSSHGVHEIPAAPNGNCIYTLAWSWQRQAHDCSWPGSFFFYLCLQCQRRKQKPHTLTSTHTHTHTPRGRHILVLILSLLNLPTWPPALIGLIT